MKTQLLLSTLFCAASLTLQAQSVNFSDVLNQKSGWVAETKPATSTYALATPSETYGNFTFWNDGTSVIAFDYSKKTVDGVVYFTRCKMGGASVWSEDETPQPVSRAIEYTAPSAGSFKLVVAGSNTADDKIMILAKGKVSFEEGTDYTTDPNFLAKLDIPASADNSGWRTATIDYTGEGGKVFLFSKTGGINLYKIEFVASGTTALQGVQADRGVVSTEYFGITGVQSSEAIPGINLVKTTYSDGTTSVEKVIIR